MDWCYPAKIKPGMTIAFTAPASASEEDMDALRALVEVAGYRAVFGESCFRRGEYGGTPEEQANELNYFLTDASCDAVVAVRGGYGCARYLERLDYAGIRRAAKPFVGYSDCTSLLQAIGVHSRLVTYHGPMGVDWLRSGRESDVADLWDLLEGRKKEQVLLSNDGDASGNDELSELQERSSLFPRRIEGRLWGGNATVLCSISGTAYMPSLAEWQEAILILEDIGEPPYKLDRLLQQLRLQGILQSVRGILLGTFTDCKDEDTNEIYDMKRMIITYAMEGRTTGDIPFIGHIPLGHGAPHKALSIGQWVHIENGCISWT